FPSASAEPMTPDVSVPAIIVRGLTILAMAGLIGALGLDVLVFPGGVEALEPACDRLRRWRRLCIVVLACATLAELIVRPGTMTGAGLAATMAALPTVLGRTHFGTLWLTRLGALALALASSFSRARRATIIALLAALGIALT